MLGQGQVRIRVRVRVRVRVRARVSSGHPKTFKDKFRIILYTLKNDTWVTFFILWIWQIIKIGVFVAGLGLELIFLYPRSWPGARSPGFLAVRHLIAHMVLHVTIAPVLNGWNCRVLRRGRTLDRRLRAHQVRRSRQHQFGRQLSLLVRAAREVGGGYGGDGEEGRGDRTQGGNSTFSQQQSRRMQERVVEYKIDGDSLESLSTEKINGQANVGVQYMHTIVSEVQTDVAQKFKKSSIT